MSALVDSSYARQYRELLRIASSIVRREPWSSATPGSLVHDSFLKLRNAVKLEVESDQHFRRVAARAMLQVLRDRARRRVHGPIEAWREEWGPAEAQVPSIHPDQIEKHMTLVALVDELHEQDAVAADAFVLDWAGYTQNEIAETLSKSLAQTQRDLKRGLTWLAGRADSPTAPVSAP